MQIEDAPRVADIHTRAWQVAYKGITIIQASEIIENARGWGRVSYDVRTAKGQL